MGSVPVRTEPVSNGCSTRFDARFERISNISLKIHSLVRGVTCSLLLSLPSKLLGKICTCTYR